MKYKEFIPVEIFYAPEEKPLWGRLIEINEDEYTILSKYDLRKYKKIHISFSINDTKIENLALKIINTQMDNEYYFYYHCKLMLSQKEEINKKLKEGLNFY